MTLLPKLVRVGVHCSVSSVPVTVDSHMYTYTQVASFSSVWQKAVQTAYEKGLMPVAQRLPFYPLMTGGESDYLPALCLLYQ